MTTPVPTTRSSVTNAQRRFFSVPSALASARALAGLTGFDSGLGTGAAFGTGGVFGADVDGLVLDEPLVGGTLGVADTGDVLPAKGEGVAPVDEVAAAAAHRSCRSTSSGPRASSSVISIPAT